MRFKISLNKMHFFLSICLFALFVFQSSLWAGEPSDILVINSNANVEKYKAVQDEFIKGTPYSVTTLDLGDGPDGEKIERLISGADLVCCIGAKAYRASYRHAKNKKVVFSSIINWRRLPMTDDTYGVSNELHTRMTILMYRSIFPKMKKIGILYSRAYTLQWFNDAKKEAEELGLEIIGRPISDSSHTERVLNGLLDNVDAYWLIPDPTVMPEKKALFNVLDICDKRKKPVLSYLDAFSVFGATLVVSADNPTIGRQAAGIAMDILSGKEIVDKVQFPAGSRITLNMKKVQDYGLEYNKNALRLVNRILK